MTCLNDVKQTFLIDHTVVGNPNLAGIGERALFGVSNSIGLLETFCFLGLYVETVGDIGCDVSSSKRQNNKMTQNILFIDGHSGGFSSEIYKCTPRSFLHV